jgi:cytosol alanyl aminopeptidase
MREVIAALAALAFLAGMPAPAHAQAPAEGKPMPPALRIPDGARPTRYQVTLTVVPGDAKAQGEIAIDIELDRPHPVLWLNADALSVSRATTSAAGTRVAILSGLEQFVGLAFEPALAAGKHRLTLAFEAEQSRDSMRGIFALQDGGAWYVMTQFEATSARRAYPCFDEPGFKVPWQLTLRVPRALTALSNTPIVSETDTADGMKLVRFAETRPLSSYLVAFAIGPWEIVDLGRFGIKPTPLRIVVPRGRAADTAFAARAYPQLFDRMERWFGIPHPYEKLDQIAIPLTVGFAMENVGLITYGAPILLAKPNAASPKFRRDAASIGAHEMSHQWFGNLVTAAWWDDIWLNEAFATWFAEKMVDQWQPDYEHGAGRIEARARAIDEDALSSARKIREPILSRGDIFNAFDSITYQKGATVIGMFEGWIGEEPFRRGVRRYLESRRDGNATVDDFLGALSTGSGRPVGPAFSTFLNQNGAPQIEVKLQCAAGRAALELSQHRLQPLGAASGGDQRWQIPVCARYGKGTAAKQSCTLLTERSATLDLDGACPAFVFANAGGRGYYVADYRDDLLPRLAANRSALTPPEYASLLYDLRALVRAGSVSGAEALEWVRPAFASRERHVVRAAIELAQFVRDTFVDEASRARFSAFVRQVAAGRVRALGFVPRRNEGDDDQLLRRALIGFAAPEDPKLVAEARRLALAWIGNRHAIDPGLVDTVLIVAARNGDAALFDAMLAEARTTADRLDRRHLIVALFSFTDAALARRGQALLLDTGFDIRELTNAMRDAHYANPPRRATHDFIAANFDAFAGRVSRDTPGGWPTYAERLCTEKDRADVEAFWRDRIAKYAGGERDLAQALESIELCARLRTEQQKSVAAFLAKY